jgi:hypothetical protein
MVDLRAEPRVDPVTPNGKWLNLAPAQNKLNALFIDILEHPGFGELHVNVRIMKDARKEVILNSGKEYRFVLAQHK